jgi:hypothetical protein
MRLPEIYSRILGSKGSKLHRQSTGGCVCLAPSSGLRAPSSSFSEQRLARMSALMVGTQQGHRNNQKTILNPSLSLLIMWGSRPLLTVSTTDWSILHSAEVVHFHHSSRKSSEALNPTTHVLIRNNTTLSRCDFIGTLRSLYKDMQKHQQPTTVTAPGGP